LKLGVLAQQSPLGPRIHPLLLVGAKVPQEGLAHATSSMAVVDAVARQPKQPGRKLPGPHAIDVAKGHAEDVLRHVVDLFLG
jgi:hypothetical protein